MRHHVNTRKLGRTSAHRLAMYRNMVTSLLEHERVETTHAKARELRRVADRMITLGKRGDLHARRQAAKFVRSRDVAGKLFGELAQRYADRPGGYTRVLRLRRRVGDAAEMSIVELVEEFEPRKKTEKAKKTASKKKSSGAKKAASEKKATASKKTASTKKATRKKKTSAAAQRED